MRLKKKIKNLIDKMAQNTEKSEGENIHPEASIQSFTKQKVTSRLLHPFFSWSIIRHGSLVGAAVFKSHESKEWT